MPQYQITLSGFTPHSGGTVKAKDAASAWKAYKEFHGIKETSFEPSIVEVKPVSRRGAKPKQIESRTNAKQPATSSDDQKPDAGSDR